MLNIEIKYKTPAIFNTLYNSADTTYVKMEAEEILSETLKYILKHKLTINTLKPQNVTWTNIYYTVTDNILTIEKCFGDNSPYFIVYVYYNNINDLTNILLLFKITNDIKDIPINYKKISQIK